MKPAARLPHRLRRRLLLRPDRPECSGPSGEQRTSRSWWQIPPSPCRSIRRLDALAVNESVVNNKVDNEFVDSYRSTILLNGAFDSHAIFHRPLGQRRRLLRPRIRVAGTGGAGSRRQPPAADRTAAHGQDQRPPRTRRTAGDREMGLPLHRTPVGAWRGGTPRRGTTPPGASRRCSKSWSTTAISKPSRMVATASRSGF